MSLVVSTVADRRVGERNVIATTLRNVWPSLPALTVASATLCLAAVVPVLIAPGPNPVAALAAAVCVAPFALALVAVVVQLADDDHGTLRTWWRTVTQRGRFAIAHALVAAVPMALFLVALHVHAVTAAPWVWPSIAVSGGVAVLAGLGLCAVYPLAVAPSTMSSRQLWLAALSLVAARPVRFLAVGAAFALFVRLSTQLTASLLLFAPAPTAIVAVTATWTTAIATGAVTPRQPGVPR